MDNKNEGVSLSFVKKERAFSHFPIYSFFIEFRNNGSSLWNNLVVSQRYSLALGGHYQTGMGITELEAIKLLV